MPGAGTPGRIIETEVYERDPAITARFQGYRLMLSAVGLEALHGCVPQRWHRLLDAVVGDATASGLVLDPQLNQIGELGPARNGIVVDRDVLRRLLLTGLTVHTGAALTGYHVRDDGQNGRVDIHVADRAPATADLLVGADGVNSAVPPSPVPAHLSHRHRCALRRRSHPADRAVRRTVACLRRAKILGDGTSLLLGAMRLRTPPARAAEALAPEVSLPDIGDYVRWAMILPPRTDCSTT